MNTSMLLKAGAMVAASLSIGSMAHAFTLIGSSALQGWDTETLTFSVNASDCLISEAELNDAIDQAMALWNSVPTSGIRLERGASVSTTPAQASAGTASSGVPTPLIVCDPNMSQTIDPSTPNAADQIPASTTNKATGLRLNYSYVLLNAEASAPANIQRIQQILPGKLAIIIAHELGHVLGLGHSRDPSNLMYYDATVRANLTLSQDDIDGVTFLYPRHELGETGVLGCGAVAGPGSSGSLGPPGSSGFGDRSGQRGWIEFAGLFALCGLATVFARRRALLGA